MSLPFDRVDDLFAQRFAEGLTPGQVHGVVRGGEVIHAGAFGSVGLTEDVVPTVDHVFRIASMSKSFTAAAILLLRDRGLVELDEAVAQYVPELVDLPPYSPGSPALTLRLLLSMSAGLLTDDPWGDRQESLSYEAFGTFLDGGLTVGRESGVGYEYSNLGYALLGRVIENVTGGADAEGANRDFIEHELLAPLGMTASCFASSQVGSSLVAGHQKWSTGWEALAPTEPGAFSAMGGLHSSVTDLARWIHGFVTAFRPEADGHPLSKASRREMQQVQRFGSVSGTLSPSRGHGAVAMGYGFGVMVDHDAELGPIVHHSGGYPGYGSRMVWHPETGIGVVTLSNGTYAGAYDQAMSSVKELVRSEGRRSPGPRVPATLTAVDYATDRLVGFDPDVAVGPFADPDRFADNVELDTPDTERRAALKAGRALVGAPKPVGNPAIWSRAMAHAGWSVPAERGRYDLEILLSPEETPRIQRLQITAVADAAEDELARARALLATDTAEVRILRTFGEPVLIEHPVTNPGQGRVEFVVKAGPTWWKVLVTADDARCEAHLTSSYSRLAHVAELTRE